MNILASLRPKVFAHAAAKSMRDRRGVTALEYGLIAAVVAAAIVTAFTQFGDGLSDTFENINKAMTDTSAKAIPKAN